MGEFQREPADQESGLIAVGAPTLLMPGNYVGWSSVKGGMIGWWCRSRPIQDRERLVAATNGVPISAVAQVSAAGAEDTFTDLARYKRDHWAYDGAVLAHDRNGRIIPGELNAYPPVPR